MSANERRVHSVAPNADRFGESRSMGISTLCFKVSGEDTGGGVFIIEQIMRERGGPPRHVHPDQEEWFYAIEGEYLVEVGQDRFTLTPGGIVLAPRGIAHVWAFVSDGVGRLQVGFSPAGNMEAFFREVTRANAMPSMDPAVWLAHGMQVTGPPLPVR